MARVLPKHFLEDEIVSKTDEYFHFTYSLLLIIKMELCRIKKRIEKSPLSKLYYIVCWLCWLTVCVRGTLFSNGKVIREKIIFMTFLFDTKGNLSECKPEKRWRSKRQRQRIEKLKAQQGNIYGLRYACKKESAFYIYYITQICSIAF